MTEELKTRKCLKCRQTVIESKFIRTPSKFFPSHLSLICTPCLETMVKADDLDDVNRLCQHLDIPFDADKWTSLYEIHKEHTLTAYSNMLLDEHYSGATWADENARWELARRENYIDDEIKVISEAHLRKLRKVWSPAYTNDELLFLDSYYNQICATQNVSTPILQHLASDLCETELQIKKVMRGGPGDLKKLMDARDNIIKVGHFEASNAKNNADFESIGELMVYYGKLGWHPKWHTEPQDSIDFMMQNIQNYLKRLVINEGNFSEQVEQKRERYNMTERLENLENEHVEFDESADIEYEGEDELESELNG